MRGANLRRQRVESAKAEAHWTSPLAHLKLASLGAFTVKARRQQYQKVIVSSCDGGIGIVTST